jgi:hypothetical protein
VASQILEVRPIACTLSVDELKVRLEGIARLNSAALLSHRRDDLRLGLTYDANARAGVLEMVAGEEVCCAFLTFEVQEDPGTFSVIIHAPESARAEAETVFEPFRLKAPARVGCARCGAAA